MRVGDRVEVVRKGRVLFSGTLVELTDDADTVQANVEEYAKIRNEHADVLGFRRPARGFEFVDSGWIARSKTKARTWGFVSIRSSAPRASERGE